MAEPTKYTPSENRTALEGITKGMKRKDDSLWERAKAALFGKSEDAAPEAAAPADDQNKAAAERYKARYGTYPDWYTGG